jgi:adenylosuccinate synthase
VGPKDINGVVGIVKAYTTRVGAGPFPSELFDDIGDRIQKTGAEFGATTGRKRRCGWLDTVILNNAVRLNGLTGLAITKLDVLGELDELKICTAYELTANRSRRASQSQPSGRLQTGLRNPARLEKGHPRHPRYDNLPEVARNTWPASKLTGVPIQIVSVGPGRDETIVLNNPFNG